jgi:hypothetical protein
MDARHDIEPRRRQAQRTALVLGAVALAFFVGSFVFLAR